MNTTITQHLMDTAKTLLGPYADLPRLDVPKYPKFDLQKLVRQASLKADRDIETHKS